MQKAILISIKPQHVLNILTGKKTLELRKSVPKNFEGWVYIYCTKSKPFLHQTEKYILKEYPNTEKFILNDDPMVAGFDILNGHVIARFWFDEYTKLKFGRWVNHKVGDWNYRGYMDEHLETFKKACLTEEEVNNYGDGKLLYAWHIKKLEVFDEPVVLSDFQKEEYAVTPNGIFPAYQPISKSPQSWMFVYTNEQLP